MPHKHKKSPPQQDKLFYCISVHFGDNLKSPMDTFLYIMFPIAWAICVCCCWNLLLPLLCNSCIMCVLYLDLQYKAHYCLGFTLLFLVTFLGVRPVVFMISHCLAVYLCAMTQSALLVWMGSLLILASLQLDYEFRAWQVCTIYEHCVFELEVYDGPGRPRVDL